MLFSFQDREDSELRSSEERSSRERLNLSTVKVFHTAHHDASL